MIFTAIRESHDLQRDLCRKLCASRGGVAVRELLFLQLKVELMAHAAAEERHLYIPLLMHDAGLDASRHALHEHHQIDELLEELSVRNKMKAGWLAHAKALSYKVRHHLKEEESKFFQLAGRLLPARTKQQLAGRYDRELARMRRRYAAELGSVTVSAKGRVQPSAATARRRSVTASARAGATLRGRGKPRQTR